MKITGIDKLISRLTNLANAGDSKMREFLEKLAAIGVSVAAVKFGNAQYDGDNDVKVLNPQWVSDKRLEIVAVGNAVTFIEFGTGITYNEQHPKASELGFNRGSYGQGKGARPSWAYYGIPGTNGRIVRDTSLGSVILTEGNPPARAMYDASKEIRNNILKIAKEVFYK